MWVVLCELVELSITTLNERMEDETWEEEEDEYDEEEDDDDSEAEEGKLTFLSYLIQKANISLLSYSKSKHLC